MPARSRWHRRPNSPAAGEGLPARAGAGCAAPSTRTAVVLSRRPRGAAAGGVRGWTRARSAPPWRVPLVAAAARSACCWPRPTCGRQQARDWSARELAASARPRARERPAVPRHPGRDRRAPQRRGRAAGSQPAQGRVPGDAGARAAQPAGADPQRASSHAARRRRPSPSSTWASDVIDRQVAAPDAAGGRPARRGAHQPGQDRAADASRWT